NWPGRLRHSCPALSKRRRDGGASRQGEATSLARSDMGQSGLRPQDPQVGRGTTCPHKHGPCGKADPPCRQVTENVPVPVVVISYPPAVTRPALRLVSRQYVLLSQPHASAAAFVLNDKFTTGVLKGPLD